MNNESRLSLSLTFLFCRVNHQELTDVVHGHEPDENSILQNRQCVAVPTLYPRKHRLEHFRRFRGWAVPLHGLLNRCGPAASSQPFDEIGTRQNSLDASIRQYRKVLLRTRQQKVDRVSERIG